MSHSTVTVNYAFAVFSFFCGYSLCTNNKLTFELVFRVHYPFPLIVDYKDDNGRAISIFCLLDTIQKLDSEEVYFLLWRLGTNFFCFDGWAIFSFALEGQGTFSSASTGRETISSASAGQATFSSTLAVSFLLLYSG